MLSTFFYLIVSRKGEMAIIFNVTAHVGSKRVNTQARTTCRWYARSSCQL